MNCKGSLSNEIRNRLRDGFEKELTAEQEAELLEKTENELNQAQSLILEMQQALIQQGKADLSHQLQEHYENIWKILKERKNEGHNRTNDGEQICFPVALIDACAEMYDLLLNAATSSGSEGAASVDLNGNAIHRN